MQLNASSRVRLCQNKIDTYVTVILWGLFTFCLQAQHPFTIAFGSCGSQDVQQPVLRLAAERKPDYFIFLGDNIYGDTRDSFELKAKYNLLTSKPEFKALKTNTTILATWDDHDYGWNDSGRHYLLKEASKRIFLDFVGEPADSERRKRPGIYTSYYRKHQGKTIQLILLDTRTFRDDLIPYGGEKKDDPAFFYSLDYSPHSSSDSTLLGSDQWSWLEKEFTKPADLRVIGSSTQFGISYNGYEAWANFPHEQKRMLDLIKKTKAEGVLFLSGDVHYAEISKLLTPDMYPVYDITSSGITSTWYFATPNTNRIEGPVMDNHFGLLTVDFSGSNPYIKMECIDARGNSRFEYTIQPEELKFSH